uniref:Uncharacterized protein n=1 Tax=Strigamia maritima TaxID=126957 RepID=T1JE81_STRMM
MKNERNTHKVASIPLTRLLENNKLKTLNISMVGIYLTLAILCAYITWERMYLYWNYPTKTVVRVDKDKMVEFPSVTICASNDYVETLRKLYTEKTGKTTCVTLDNYVDISGTSVDRMWNRSSINYLIYSQQQKHYFRNYVNNLCTESTTTVFSETILNLTKVSNCQPKIFLSPEDYPIEFGLLNRLEVPMNKISIISLKYKKLYRLNTPNYKCQEKQTALYCLKKCREQLLLQKIPCRKLFLEKIGG